MDIKSFEKIQLYGFNNLTKTLSFNIYDICYAKAPEQSKAYIAYIDEQYNAERLTKILSNVADITGANILSISKQDYDPQGASVTMLVAEEMTVPTLTPESLTGESPGPLPGNKPSPGSIVTHLDKSHVTVHTYPETHPLDGISTFRADIDVSTCGHISPIKALNYLIHSFESDIVTIDYRVRGFTRDINGQKYFIDHDINSIQNYIAKDILNLYHAIDVNVYQENIFHTKMTLKDFKLNNYLFGVSEEELSDHESASIKDQLRDEMQEIFYGRNVTKV
ncbi:S-adenosylmethionine decarboxylase related [Alkaliphilus metalliredigens QYMF]|uniref:S-adenosylmethionine decarboxylase proenzyme n=1 Tax=Alkaliphilus metalliredigens (strain QYMF) TaxID=293826 RepID=SPED_ALKMQ|nr:adenosylmethionine decarboxylase [Alkaliphilus metalliredigens]A6TS03.1 RecName: Full=S-adenosylmethionine decarboxylase proenzyme; Short=AdoMetDC; Short=SAMDC; Contains: RecName: Full=S-adenosylmethionine decarboxylase beta chain; Contains: RecName: Full=S-adenosylmethionine decarboxylase alpha chain; Flags: Precursor [Alkaliphilus metalliredigens QYMF]ABR48971.1 S-adenosylmethionine decarboxylase related [Alkaliphilus metalliredigens QYMF]